MALTAIEAKSCSMQKINFAHTVSRNLVFHDPHMLGATSPVEGR